jgi:hypothetical protein
MNERQHHLRGPEREPFSQTWKFCRAQIVSTASLPHDHEPCAIKVVSNHTCLLHTCVSAGLGRVGVRLSGFRRQGISSTPGGFLKCPIPVRVCAEHWANDQTICEDDPGLVKKLPMYEQAILGGSGYETKSTHNLRVIQYIPNGHFFQIGAQPEPASTGRHN